MSDAIKRNIAPSVPFTGPATHHIAHGFAESAINKSTPWPMRSLCTNTEAELITA